MKQFRSLLSYSWISKVFIFILTLAQCGVVFAGEKSTNQKSILEEGRIIKSDRTRVEFSKATIGDSSIIYSPIGSNAKETIDINQILRIDKKNNYGLQTGVGMAVAGMFSGMFTTSSKNTDGVEIDSGTKSGIILGMGALCGLIGYAIGSNYYDYETVYRNEKVKSTFNLDILPGHNSFDSGKLKLSYNF